MIPPCDEETRKYFETIQRQFNTEFELAQKARSRGLDPEDSVEIAPAADIADRVEGLVGPKGVAEVIRKMEHEGIERDMIAHKLVEDIVSGKIYNEPDKEKRIEQAVRTALALMTESIVAAPIEGVSRVEINKNPDGSDYVSIYFAGPIRSAGGTGAALGVLFADHARRVAGVGRYIPTDSEVERYVEEMYVYDARVSRLQYMPPEDDIRFIIRNCPVCIDGEPTAEIEVSVNRNLPRVHTNRIRGGMCLVVGEGIAQKAKKVYKYSKKYKLDWDWSKQLVKEEKSEGKKKEIKPGKKYLKKVIAGRPIFAHPMKKGGFRIRYGRARNIGLAAKGFHPAVFYLTGSFMAIGTQIKIERPGKATVASAVHQIEPPIVKLKNGNVIRVETSEMAKKIDKEVEEILFLGDMLVPYGDFRKSGHLLVPSPWVEEWWVQELEHAIKEQELDSSKYEPYLKDPFNVNVSDALKISKETGIPLHPRYTFHYDEIPIDEIKELHNWINKGEIRGNDLILTLSESKRILEHMFIPHMVEEDKIIVPDGISLYETFGGGKEIDIDGLYNMLKDEFEVINQISSVKIMKKATVYAGARMSRPEKAKERKENPPIHGLFPIGEEGGRLRNLRTAVEHTYVNVDAANFTCPKCGDTIYPVCPKCGAKTKEYYVCRKCQGRYETDFCPKCNVKAYPYSRKRVNVKELWNIAIEKIGNNLPQVIKGVRGLISAEKIPERVEKVMLRAKWEVFPYKDGTIRIDGIDLALTHFKPKEIGIPISKLNELGYTKDWKGNPIVSDDQVIEIFPQDIVISNDIVDYLIRVAKYVDDMLIYMYNMKPYYNVKTKEDLIGKLVIGLAPHTSAGTLARIIGFTNARGIFGHPYFHAAKRRNCDGDEDSIMLALEGLIDFSLRFTSERKGGKMDAPIVLTTILNPTSIDDEAFEIEKVDRYPREFYWKTQELPEPGEVDIPIVEKTLDTPDQYRNFKYTHEVERIDDGPKTTTYVTLKSMRDKVEKQMAVAERVMACDPKDEAHRVIVSHFIPDIYGNLRAFSQQKLRCVDCNAKYRRIPLIGRCRKCGGKLLLTVTKGGIEKYLELALDIARKYELSPYLIQRLELVKSDLQTLFIDSKEAKQTRIEDFFI